MISVLFAAAGALTYGASDFFGGFATRRAHVLPVLFASQLASLCPLVIALWALPGQHAAGADYLWGAAAGAVATFSMMALYRALALGPMTVIAPFTAVCVAVVPVVAGVAGGERPSALAVAGLATGLLAIVLISRERPEPGAGGAVTRQAIGIALAAGVGLGAFFVLLHRTSPGSGMAPLLATRITSLVAFGGLLALRRVPVRLPRPAVGTAVAAGVLDMTGNALFLLAARSGLLSVSAVITAMYPAATVVLARTVLRERMNGWQVSGALLAMVSLGTLSLASV
ncbi:EamA family transporter [Amycolatopsis anabasis]|uniref:EamA family transporter n=1 Tax=Amycolatopsis anabasis TaxID=1840409 RepID=UPI00131EC4C8|nr:EamA family transporter [Amycolatopsis anabasis]